jgi:CelD/BcsL family acetyltransferase involved in cellulose biosynthesis
MKTSSVVHLPPDPVAADETRPRAATHPEPGRAAVEVAVTSLSGLSEADRAGWRELVAYRSESAPFVDEDWVAAWSEAFGPRESLLACGWQGGRLVGLGVLLSLNETWAGQRTAVIQSLTNVHSPRFEFLSFSCRVDVQEHLWRALCESRRGDVIRLDYLPEDSPTLSTGIKVADELGWNRVVEETCESPWRSLPRAPVAWDAGLKRKFKANLRNRERRLRTLGEVTFEVARGGTGQQAALEVFYALEKCSWKGKRGTAIAQQSHTRAFYDRLVERTGQNMWIPILSVGTRAVAAQLVRTHGRTLFMLKTAFDPDFAPYAPGQLLTARLSQYGIDNGMEALDFLGDNMVWKTDWAANLRRHYSLLLFAPSARGRYAYWTHYGIREHVKRIPGARRLVRWLRAR